MVRSSLNRNLTARFPVSGHSLSNNIHLYFSDSFNWNFIYPLIYKLDLWTQLSALRRGDIRSEVKVWTEEMQIDTEYFSLYIHIITRSKRKMGAASCWLIAPVHINYTRGIKTCMHPSTTVQLYKTCKGKTNVFGASSPCRWDPHKEGSKMDPTSK